MKVHELRSALVELETLFEVGGTKAIKTDLASLIKFLESADDMPVEEFFAELEAELKNISIHPRSSRQAVVLNEKAVSFYCDELEKSYDDEAKFISILNELNSDSRIRKIELSKIAERFGDSSAKTVSKMLQSIKTHYYEKIYDRDANAMARRATPW